MRGGILCFALQTVQHFARRDCRPQRSTQARLRFKPRRPRTLVQAARKEHERVQRGRQNEGWRGNICPGWLFRALPCPGWFVSVPRRGGGFEKETHYRWLSCADCEIRQIPPRSSGSILKSRFGRCYVGKAEKGWL